MAEYFLSEKKKVIIVGRTESNLKSAAKELGNIPYYVLDTGDLKAIPGFVKQVVKEHPELDCVVNNAGVQRPLDVNKMSPEEFLEKADQEIAINIQGPMHLSLYFLPHLRQKQNAVLMNVSSLLGYLPMSIINPNYNGTKAHVHFWSTNLRSQLKQGGSSVKIIEIVPPSVTTDLHRERDDPKDNTKEKMPAALSVDEFMDEVKEGFKSGKTTIGAGPSKQWIEKWEKEFGGAYADAEKKYVES